MVSKHLAKALRESGRYHVTAKNTSLRDLQENMYRDNSSEEWKEAIRKGKLKEYHKERNEL